MFFYTLQLKLSSIHHCSLVVAPVPTPSGHVDVFQTALCYKCSCYLSGGRSFISFLCVYLYVCVIFNCVDGTTGVFSMLCVSIKVAICRLYCRIPPCPHGSKMKLFIECRDWLTHRLTDSLVVDEPPPPLNTNVIPVRSHCPLLDLAACQCLFSQLTARLTGQVSGCQSSQRVSMQRRPFRAAAGLTLHLINAD